MLQTKLPSPLKRRVFLFTVLLQSFCLGSTVEKLSDSYYYSKGRRLKCTQGQFHWPTLQCHPNPGGYIAESIKDILFLHANLFSFDTFKIIASVSPLYIASRSFDCALQEHFYCRKHHKNLNQLDKSCKYIARFGVALPIVGLGSLAFLSSNQDMRMTSWIFLLGMPFVIFGKDVLKSIKVDACKRPWNEHFCDKKQAYGGFPSGHMAEAVYMTVLYGKRFGYKFGLPLAGVSLFLGAAFLNCNRHYFSQLVAGAALGAAYGLAADKLINCKLGKCTNIGFCPSSWGSPGVKLSCKF